MENEATFSFTLGKQALTQKARSFETDSINSNWSKYIRPLNYTI